MSLLAWYEADSSTQKEVKNHETYYRAGDCVRSAFQKVGRRKDEENDGKYNEDQYAFP